MPEAPTDPLRPAELLRLQAEVLELVATQERPRLILERLCTRVEELLPGSRAGVQHLGEGGALELLCAPSASPAELEAFRALRPGPRRGSASAALAARAPVLVADAWQDPIWGDLRAAARDHGIRAAWAWPLVDPRRGALGAFTLVRATPGLPAEDVNQLLRNAAQLALIAIERESSEAAVRAQRKLLGSIVDGSEDPIFVKDVERRYILVNAAEARGVRERPEDMLGLRDEDLYPPSVAELTRRMDEQVLATGKSLLYEQEFENRVEGRRQFLLRKSPLLDERGRARGVIGIARDVSALKRAEADLRQAQKLESLGVLAGGIAHDFNNILTGILGHAELATAAIPRGSPALHNLAEIERAVRRAADLTAQLLAYAGHSESAKRPVALPAVWEQTRTLLASTISKRARLVCAFAPALPALEADPIQLRQVLMNLVTNASEALPDGAGTIEVRAHALRVAAGDGWTEEEGGERVEPGAYVELCVRDDGSGMEPAVAARVFEPFFSTKFAGRGLGLAAVHGIVRGHGGAIRIESRPAAGTTFRVLLPVSAGSPSPTGAGSPARAEPGAGTVLVVEDEAPVREVVRRILEGQGYAVLEAEDGEAACRLFERREVEITLVLLDLSTPRLSGPEVHRRLRALRPGLPVVLASGYAEHDALAGFSAGDIARFVRKPFRGAELLAALADALRGSSAQPQAPG